MDLRKITAAGFMASLLAIPAIAQAPDAAAPTWDVLENRSRIGFGGAYQGTLFTGQFEAWETEIRFDPDRLDASSTKVTIDMGSAESGDDSRDSSLPGEDWFDVAMFPQATFETSGIRAEGDGYVADGTLTIRGISKQVSLPFTLDIQDDIARMNGALTIDRSIFGVGQGAWADGKTVALDVKVEVSLVARRAG
jgi:polyisoprenoid-binding protein YceI